MTYEFGAKEIVKGSGYISRQCCGSTEIELGTVYAAEIDAMPNGGYSDHIGFVEEVSGGNVTAIEGNKGEMVARRGRSRWAGDISGGMRLRNMRRL